MDFFYFFFFVLLSHNTFYYANISTSKREIKIAKVCIGSIGDPAGQAANLCQVYIFGLQAKPNIAAKIIVAKT